jgi:hypothetical protein
MVHPPRIDGRETKTRNTAVHRGGFTLTDPLTLFSVPGFLIASASGCDQ